MASLTVTDNAGITDPSPKTRTITVTSNGLVPTLISAAPNSGVQGLINVDVVFTGTNFLPNPVCNFGAGIEINTCTYNSATKITANIDILANAVVGPRDIIITDTDTQSATLLGGFTVIGGVAAPAPTLTGIMPNSEFQGATNVTVNLTGTNFQPSPTCNFDSDFGGTINTCTLVSPTQITVSLTISPTALLGGHNVIVTNADGQSATLINGFTITQDLGDTVKLGAGFTVGALVLNGNAQLNGSALELTDGNLAEDSSAWYATHVNIQNFSTDFTFQISPGTTADGFTFALQNNSTAALGIDGGALGYGTDVVGNPGGIPASIAVKFDLYDNAGEGINSTGLFVNGAPPNIPAIDLTSSGIDLHRGDTFAVHITYDGTNLVMKVTDTMTNAVFTTTWPIDIPTTVGSNTAYAGFTGGTGGLSATQSILNWTLSALVPASAVTITPSGPIAFPDTTQSLTSAPVVLTVTNSGTTTLNISAVSLSGANAADFAVSGTCAGAALAANATCSISATFTPGATGLRQAMLQIADNAAGSPQSIPLTANGVPAFTVTSPQSSSTATVNAGQIAQYSLQLTPGPGYSGNVTMTCSGAPATTACSVTNPIVLTSGSPTTFMVTVTTTARSSLVPYSSPRSTPPAVPYLLLLSVSVSLALLAAMYGLKLRGAFTSRQLACTTGILVLVDGRGRPSRLPESRDAPAVPPPVPAIQLARTLELIR